MNTKCGYEHRWLTRLSKRAVGGAVALLLLLPLAAWAGGVVTNCTEADLRAAMAGGGVVTFACNGTITLANTITEDLDVILDGTGHQVAISGGGVVRLLTVNTNVHFTLVSLTFTGGASQGGSAILNLGGTVTVTGVTFSGNAATGNSSSGASGGAIWNQAGQVNLQSCAFVDNRAFGGSYIMNYFVTVGASGWGGAIYNRGTATLDLCTLTGNSATGGDSGLGHDGGGPYGGSGCGGAIYSEGTLTVDRTTFGGNTAAGGSGGTGATGTPLSNDNGYNGGGGGLGCGGAVYGYGSLSVSRSTFAHNSAAGGAGGAGGDGAVPPGGSGGGGGGGGSGNGGAFSGSGALVNCTFAFNTGSGGAGGRGGSTIEFYNWPGGRGGDGGSAVGGVSGTCYLTNCTVAANSGYAGSGGSGGFSSSGNQGPCGANGTEYGGTTSSPLVNTLIASNTPAGDDSFSDPKLGPLANNGGPTPTMALLPGSPAIDAGNTSLAPATDQRGVPRPAGLAADIGAFEYGSVMPTIAISPSGTNGLNILASGNAGQSCRLLASPDLTSWVPLATNQIGSDGTVLFYDECAPGGACRFYRLVMP